MLYNQLSHLPFYGLIHPVEKKKMTLDYELFKYWLQKGRVLDKGN